jgi:hypothetical protein
VICIQNTFMQQIARTLALFLIASVLSTLPATAQHSKTAAEYLIVEHTDQLLIYNKYQQRITRQGEKAFVPFVPLRVLESNGVLNDNYTQCMKVELDGSIFFLIKNNETSLMGEGKFGFNHVYKNVVVLQDTVQLMTTSGAVLISSDRKQRFVLQHGEKLIRYFQDGDLTYIRLLFTPVRFGWARLDGIVRTIVLSENEQDHTTTSGIPDKTLSRVEAKFKEVNQLLTTLFKYFNKQSNEKILAPQWHSVESERSVAYVLEPHMYSSSFPETDRYITRDLDNILLGTIYTMSYTPGKIEIQQK